jgi:hypothetical protein
MVEKAKNLAKEGAINSQVMANPTILKNMLTTIKNLQAMLLQQSEANNSLFEALIETKKLQTIEGSKGDAFAKTIKTHP